MPSLANAIKLADAFECPLDYLFGFTDDFVPMRYKLVESVDLRIKRAVDSCGKSRYALAKKASFKEPQLCRWYNGKKMPSLVSLLELAEALDCSLDFLAGRDYQ